MKELFKFKYDDYSTSIFEDYNEVNKDKPLFFKSKRPFSDLKSIKNTEEDYVKNYGNPLAQVSHDYQLLVISSDETKVSLKLFKGSRLRKSFTNYFTKKTFCKYITVSKKTGDMYSGVLRDYHKKRKSKKVQNKNQFDTNYFLSIDADIKCSLKPELRTEYQDLYHQFVFLFLKELGIEYSNSPNLMVNNELLKYYGNKKGLKYPDNIWAFFKKKCYNPKLNEIRKSKGKFIDAFMKKNHLSGKIIKKALHNSENVNVGMLKKTLDFFGEDWVYQDYDFTLYCLNSQIYVSDLFIQWFPQNLKFLTTIEKRRAFIFFKEYILALPCYNLNTFLDHLSMIEELRLLGENDISWRATNISEFNLEHQNFTSKIEYYRKGYYLRVYQKELFDMVESPIVTNDGIFYPVLIKDSDEYINESFVQSNCVKTYIGNPSSYIVSLRKNEKNSEDRATIELHLTKKEKKLPYFMVRQSLGKFNRSLDQEWDTPIQTLLSVFTKYLSNDNFQLIKLEKTLQNGKKLSSDTYWDENGDLKWNSVDLTYYYE